jgi:glycosyltransferase involved in cell wall biosynthesis
MKIAFLNIYSGIINRGAERSTSELADRLGKNHEVWLFQGGEDKRKSHYKTIVIPPVFPNFADSSFSFLRKFYLDIWSINILFFTLKIIPLLWNKNFDVVIPINGGWQTVLCRIITWLKSKKTVIIGRAGIGRDDRWNLIWKPDVFVALTNAALSWAKDKAKKVKVVRIPNGVDLAEFSSSGDKARLSLSKPLILCVGALVENKRIDLTIKAVSKIKNCSLLILGDGLLKENLQTLGEKLLGNKRFIIKTVGLSQMPEYYRVADVFTLVSERGEAFGNVYLEAMASNLPVVTVDDETRREIMGNAGIFIESDNVEVYARALERAIKTDFGNVPRERAKKYSWEKIVREYENLFKQLENI